MTLTSFPRLAFMCFAVFAIHNRPVQGQQQLLELNKGDHIAVIGNTLADRMQHSGFLEAQLHRRFPEHNLVVRDLGFSGDTITERPRSENFGSPDQWLSKVKADVVIAFFGYNESYAGEAGLPQFRKDLEEYIDHTLSQEYNGKSAPKFVLCSPTAFEDLKWPHLPDGKDRNQRLQLYTTAMSEVAKAKSIQFVDLFAMFSEQPTAVNWDGSAIRNLEGQRRDRFGEDVYPDRPSDIRQFKRLAWTINGVHLNDVGNSFVARSVAESLGPQRSVAADADPIFWLIHPVREAVLAKNRIWHNIYRATDGYSVFGGRSTLQFVDGQTNFDVMQRELEILEVCLLYTSDAADE